MAVLYLWLWKDLTYFLRLGPGECVPASVWNPGAARVKRRINNKWQSLSRSPCSLPTRMLLAMYNTGETKIICWYKSKTKCGLSIPLFCQKKGALRSLQKTAQTLECFCRGQVDLIQKNPPSLSNSLNQSSLNKCKGTHLHITGWQGRNSSLCGKNKPVNTYEKFFN